MNDRIWAMIAPNVDSPGLMQPAAADAMGVPNPVFVHEISHGPKAMA